MKKENVKRISPTRYPRNVASSEITTQRSMGDIREAPIQCEGAKNERIIVLTRKNFEYNCSYAFIMDGIAAYCMERAKTKDIALLSNGYYSIRLTPDEFETYCIGDYINCKKIRRSLWKSFAKVAKEPRTLPMHTDEGIFFGEPIRILIKRDSESTKNKHGGEIINLRNQQNTTQIEYIQIDFFRLMFKDVVEDGKSWISLPRNLQAILEYLDNEKPELLEFTYKSKIEETSERIRLSIEMVRKYFLYVSLHNNNKGERMNIDAINFWLCIQPSVVRGSTTEGYKLKEWYKLKHFVEALTNLHNKLVEFGYLKGINFTTGKAYYHKDTQTYEISINRQKK